MNRASRRALRARSESGPDLAHVLAAIFRAIGAEICGLAGLTGDEAARGAFELYMAGRLQLVTSVGRGISCRMIDPPVAPPDDQVAVFPTIARLLGSNSEVHR